MIYTSLTNRALRLAYNAHQGQVDKSGQPYIFHPYHLAEQMPDEISVCVALLHDVLEDTDVSLEELEALFPPEVTDTVSLLTRKPEQDYLDYIRAVKKHPAARMVKLADLAHNSDESRFAGCEDIVDLQTEHMSSFASDMRRPERFWKRKSDVVPDFGAGIQKIHNCLKKC